MSHLLSSVHAELVEAPFSIFNRVAEGGLPFDKLRANGGKGNAHASASRSAEASVSTSSFVVVSVTATTSPFARLASPG